MTLPGTPFAERADAQRNRARLLQVAREAPAEDGAASLNSIARSAGVGPETVYLHFPSREALVLASYSVTERSPLTFPCVSTSGGTTPGPVAGTLRRPRGGRVRSPPSPDRSRRRR